MDVATRRPSVIFELGELTTAIPVERARWLGQQLIGIAMEAETQGFLLDWMTQHFGQFTTEQATTLAMQFRQYVAQQRGAGRGQGGPARGEGGPGPNAGGPPRLDR
jgi:hypothetical protein